jgi:hypothetical protein
MADADAKKEEAEEEDQGSVSLVSQEGDSFDVSMGVARMSELVKTMIDGESGGLVGFELNSCAGEDKTIAIARAAEQPPATAARSDPICCSQTWEQLAHWDRFFDENEEIS